MHSVSFPSTEHFPSTYMYKRKQSLSETKNNKNCASILVRLECFCSCVSIDIRNPAPPLRIVSCSEHIKIIILNAKLVISNAKSNNSNEISTEHVICGSMLQALKLANSINDQRVVCVRVGGVVRPFVVILKGTQVFLAEFIILNTRLLVFDTQIFSFRYKIPRC